ncbi:hypothetical protein ACLOJK_035785 [Asimina triloba]
MKHLCLNCPPIILLEEFDVDPCLNNLLVWVKDQIHRAGCYVDVDTTDRNIQKKVREAQLVQYNYILVVGEEAATMVSVRVRDKGDHQVMSMADLLNHFREETAEYH